MVGPGFTLLTALCQDTSLLDSVNTASDPKEPVIFPFPSSSPSMGPFRAQLQSHLLQRA